MILSRTPQGFTLVEMIVVIALIGIIGSLTAFSDLGAYKRVLASTDVDTVMGALRQARSDAMHGVCFDGSCNIPPAHGVLITKNKLVIFEGSRYKDRLVAADEELALTNLLNTSGEQEITFAPVTGEPAKNMSLQLEVSSGETWRIDSSLNGVLTSTLVNSKK